MDGRDGTGGHTDRARAVWVGFFGEVSSLLVEQVVWKARIRDQVSMGRKGLTECIPLIGDTTRMRVLWFWI